MEGIKETMELLEALKELASVMKKIVEDGKVSLKDLPLLLELVKKLPMLKAGVDGVDQVPKEIKSLTQEEVQALLAKVYEIVGVLKA